MSWTKKRLQRLKREIDKLKVKMREVKGEMASSSNKPVVEMREVMAEIAFIKEKVEEMVKILDREEKRSGTMKESI